MPDDEFRALIRSHQTTIWRYLRFLGCDPGEADDLTQETFLAVVGRPVHRFGKGGARAYLRTVARNFYLKLRARKPHEPVLVDLQTAELAFDWCTCDVEGDDHDGTTTLAALRHCLLTLSPSCREALDLRYRDGLSRGAISEQLAMSTHGVKSLLQRGYARLRACMKRRLEHD